MQEKLTQYLQCRSAHIGSDLAGLGYATTSALVKTAAQEYPGKEWQSLGLDANSATEEDCEATQKDQYGATHQSGIVYRPQLQPLTHDENALAPSRLKGTLLSTYNAIKVIEASIFL